MVNRASGVSHKRKANSRSLCVTREINLHKRIYKERKGGGENKIYEINRCLEMSCISPKNICITNLYSRNRLKLYKISMNPINVIWNDITCKYNSNISERCDIIAVYQLSPDREKKTLKRVIPRSNFPEMNVPQLVWASGFEWLSIKPEIRNDFYDWSAESTINRLVNLIEQILECISGESSRKDCKRDCFASLVSLTFLPS